MPVTLQDHIHLSSTSSDVTTPVDSSIWSIKRWGPIPRITLTLERTQTQNLKRWVARDSAGNEVRQTDYQYSVVVQPRGAETLLDRLTRLYNMNGRVVYLHDVFHDSAAHGSGAKTMVLQITDEPEVLDPMLQKVYVNIQLTDASL